MLRIYWNIRNQSKLIFHGDRILFLLDFQQSQSQFLHLSKLYMDQQIQNFYQAFKIIK
jgi:hypothetical protein